MAIRRNEALRRQSDFAVADTARALSKRGPTDSATPRRLIRDEVLATFGDRVDGMLLFGSRARGDARPDSDWDVAVLLKDERRGWSDLSAAGDVRYHILDETGEMVDILVLGQGMIDRSALGAAIRRDGVPL